jgi:hypothetical protein
MKASSVTMAVLAIVAGAACLHAGGPRVHFTFNAVHGGGWYRPYPVYPRAYIYDYAPPPVYVYPAPVMQPVLPAYAAPAYTPAPSAPAPAATPPAAQWTTRTEPRANALPTATATVTVRNPSASGGPVAFVVDEAREVTLQAGQTQTLSSQPRYIVEFDRGGDFGVARKTLTSGAYEFQVTDRGWDLIEAARVAQKPAPQPNALPSPTRR